MKTPIPAGRHALSLTLVLVTALTGCHSSTNNRTVVPAPTPDPIAVTGIVSDSVVLGGTVYAFAADRINEVLGLAEAASDRAAALAAANPVAMMPRAPNDADTYTLEIPASLANEAIFVAFDNEGAVDRTFGDSPPNLESVAIAGAAGSELRINVSPHTTLIAQIVRAQLDPDGDGMPIDVNAIRAAIGTAENLVLRELAGDSLGGHLFGGQSPIDLDDTDTLHEASAALGLTSRTLAALWGIPVDAALAALAGDIADGSLDGALATGFDRALAQLALDAAEMISRTDDSEFSVFAQGACSTSAVSLRRACAVDTIDNLLEGRAVCADLVDEDDHSECLDELDLDQEEDLDSCAAVLDARLALCSVLNDAAHEPAFGSAFAANFVDPLEIGSTVEPNPYLPLVQGNVWVYEGSFEEDGELVNETITVTVRDEIKLIDGVPCVVVNDVVVSDAGAKEDTNDWFAQDLDGNVWYCGEISRDFELFDGDEPQLFELVHTEGSWKHGRDGAKAGILIPAAPEVGDVIRQEVLYGEAEDVIEILSVTGSETAPAGACAGDCLVTRDFTPLDPGVEENKYYAAGIGKIVEIKVETGDRFELKEFHSP